MNKIHKGEVKSGKFIPDNPAEYNKRFWFFEGQRCEEVVRKPKKKVSHKQFKYLYKVVYQLIHEDTGQSIESIDIEMKLLFWYTTGITGIRIPRSKKEHTTVTEEKFHTDVRNWASEFRNLYIPLPNEVDF